MCEKERYKIATVPCTICVVNDCKDKDRDTMYGCCFGKVSNQMLTWAFEYTNALRYAGVKKPV